jgi:hypothetical protein
MALLRPAAESAGAWEGVRSAAETGARPQFPPPRPTVPGSEVGESSGARESFVPRNVSSTISLPGDCLSTCSVPPQPVRPATHSGVPGAVLGVLAQTEAVDDLTPSDTIPGLIPPFPRALALRAVDYANPSTVREKQANYLSSERGGQSSLSGTRGVGGVNATGSAVSSTPGLDSTRAGAIVIWYAASRRGGDGMCSRLEDQIRCAAANARDLLGQLGPLAWALHVARPLAGAFAVAVDREPEGHVEIRTSETEAERGERKRRVVRALRDLQSLRSDACLDLFESAGYRRAVNRSIVVYAAAVLEQLLAGPVERLWRERGGALPSCGGRDKQPTWPDSFGSRLRCLASAKVDLYDRQRCVHYPEAALLALYRHKVVHSDCRMDDRTPRQMDEIQRHSGRPVRFRLSEDQSSVVWASDAGQELCPLWVAKRLPISLAIDEVLLPLLVGAQRFVAEAECVLAEAARASTPSA